MMGCCNECGRVSWLYLGLCGYCNDPDLKDDDRDDERERKKSKEDDE